MLKTSRYKNWRERTSLFFFGCCRRRTLRQPENLCHLYPCVESTSTMENKTVRQFQRKPRLPSSSFLRVNGKKAIAKNTLSELNKENDNPVEDKSIQLTESEKEPTKELQQLRAMKHKWDTQIEGTSLEEQEADTIKSRLERVPDDETRTIEESIARFVEKEIQALRPSKASRRKPTVQQTNDDLLDDYFPQIDRSTQPPSAPSSPLLSYSLKAILPCSPIVNDNQPNSGIFEIDGLEDLDANIDLDKVNLGSDLRSIFVSLQDS